MRLAATSAPDSTRRAGVHDGEPGPLLPLAIQSRGVLLAFVRRGDEWRLTHASRNVDQVGLRPEALLNCRLGDLFDGQIDVELRRAKAHGASLGERAPLHIGDLSCPVQDRPGLRYEAAILVHRRKDRLLVELEGRANLRDPELDVTRVANRIRHQTVVADVAQVAAEQVVAMTMFDRVMVQQFDEDGHGTVVAEAGTGAMPTYLGLRFPSFDMPAAIHEQFLVNHIHHLASTEAEPVALVGGGEAPDLTFASLRTASPDQIEYVRNQGARTAMQVAVLVDDRLWGLITCHSVDAQLTSFRHREACVAVAQMLGQQIEHCVMRDARARRRAIRGASAGLIGWIATGEELGQSLRWRSSALVDLVEAQGAAVILDDTCRTFGTSPSKDEVLWLAAALRDRRLYDGEGAFFTAAIGQALPEWTAPHDIAAGVLAVSLSENASDCLIWFRGEPVREVRWAGRPEPVVEIDGDVTRQRPRRDFSEWREQVRGRASDWHSVDIDAATELRHGIISTRGRRMLEAQLMHAQQMESIGEIAAGVAHEINTPIQFVSHNYEFVSEAISSLFQLLDDYQTLTIDAVERGAIDIDALAALHERAEAADLEFVQKELPAAMHQSHAGVQRVSEIVKAMKQFSHPSRGAMQMGDINTVVGNAVTMSRSEWKTVARVTTDLEPGLPQVPLLISAFGQVMLNLIVNAAHAVGDRFAGQPKPREGLAGRISVTTRRNGDMVDVIVADNGGGIPAHVLPHIFTPFFTTKPAGKGTGQGLAIAWNTVVKRHEGRLDVRTSPGEGTEFIIGLPLRTPPAN